MKRREFLKKLPMGLGVAGAIPILGRSAFALQGNRMIHALTNPYLDSDRVLVIIFLRGGNDGLNTLIPFTDPTYQKVRPNTGFNTADERARLTRKASDTLAFNPYMQRFADLYDAGNVAIVQNIGMTVPTLSHFHATDIWNHSCDVDQILTTGWIGRWMESVYPEYPLVKPADPIAIAMGNATSDIFQSSRNSMEVLVKDPNHYVPFGVSDGGNTPQTLGGNELAFVRDMMTVSDYYGKRFAKLFPQYAQNKIEYPESAIAQNLKQTAWCIAAGLQTKLYFIELDGFDTHYFQSSKNDVPSSHAILLRQLSEALYAFQMDLKKFGLEKRVLAMTYSEFGRRVSENGDFSSGTDHGTAAPHFVIGSEVNGGLYGRDPDLDNLDDNGDLLSQFEFRQMYASVMGDWFGVSKETCTAVLSPGRDHVPFETEFPLNDGGRKQKLVREYIAHISESKARPRFRLKGNYPNPADRSTRLSFELMQSENVRLELFDPRGSLIATILNTRLGAGEHIAELRTAELAAGSYIYRLTIGQQFETRRLSVMR